MQQLLNVSNLVALVITIVFVTGYVLFGGTYAHVCTNMFQGLLMIAVSVLVIGSGILVMTGTEDFWGAVAGAGEGLMSYVNPESRLFKDIFSTYILAPVLTEQVRKLLNKPASRL